MRVFVYEYFCSGACKQAPGKSSLFVEGFAMLRACLEDFSAAANDRCVTLLNSRLRTFDGIEQLSRWADIVWTDSPTHERSLFNRWSARADATFVIAPETDGLLLDRRNQVESSGGCFLGHSANAIHLCGDKLAFHGHLEKHGFPTIPTVSLAESADKSAFDFPIVVKPRYGAGSQDTFLLKNRQDFRTLIPRLSASGFLQQPWIDGKSLSVAALVGDEESSTEIFPIGRQLVSAEGGFRYAGGVIPFSSHNLAGSEGLLRSLCRSIPGLRGYIGFDLLLTADPVQLLVVEANPRLTTAYLGYRALSHEKLVRRILEPAMRFGSIAWRPGGVQFHPDGHCTMSSAVFEGSACM